MYQNLITRMALMFATSLSLIAQLENVELAWVQHYGSENVSSSDYTKDMAIDSAGNIYVTGLSHDSGVANVVTVKYNPDGSEAWVATYAGSAVVRSTEMGDIGVDMLGNVYVGGTTWDSVTDGIYTLIKYLPNGEQSWVAFYSGPGYWNRLEAIALDSAGNIYVTGRSGGTVSHGDYTTVKYNSSGTELWVARYNGPGNDWDGAYAIATDTLGNVYVSGSSGGSNGNDIATIKYTSEGSEVWVARYNGPANSDDGADFLTVDDSGTVYVVGVRDMHYGNEFVTIKYNPDGSEAWLISNADYERDGKRSLAVDNAGNVYTTGSSEASNSNSGNDFLTIKYNPDGSRAWFSRYNGPGNSMGVAVDETGNVYVVGYSQVINNDNYTLIKYDSTGNQLWVRNPEGRNGYARSIDLDNQGNIYISGDTDGDYATFKFTPDGIESWVARYEGTTYSIDLVSDMTMDTDGNIIVTGSSANIFFGFNLDNDLSTIKYNSDGSVAWIAKYNSPYRDWASSVTVDETGNVYIAGSSYGVEGGSNISEAVTIKYNPDGTELWVAQHTGVRALDLAVDDYGNVYITGDTLTIKYNPDGSEAWTAPIENTGDLKLAIDINGNVYISGNSYLSENSPQSTIKTVKYSPDGEESWTSLYSGPANMDDYGEALAVDSYGNVYVSGTSRTGGGGSDFDWVTIKYNTDGNEIWTKDYNSPEGHEDNVSDMVIDAVGNIYVTGSAGGSKCVTIKYNSDGSEVWVNNFNADISNGWYVRDLKLDGARNVYVTMEAGALYEEVDSEFITLKYNSDGSEAWVMNYGSEINIRNSPIACAIDFEGNVFVAGTSGAYSNSMYMSSWYWANYTTIKYSQPNYPVSIDNESIPTEFQLAQNYPNPFNPTTTIRYALPEQSMVNLTVFNIQGQEVIALQDDAKPPGNYEVRWNGIDQSGNPVSTGVYFCRLEAGNYSKTIKMVYLK